jgi:hypothetical protein
MQLEVVESVTQTMGSLALVYPYLRRLGLAEKLDALTTSGKQRAVPTGQIIEVWIVNRLAQRPAPISQLEPFAEESRPVSHRFWPPRTVSQLAELSQTAIGAWAQAQAIEAV